MFKGGFHRKSTHHLVKPDTRDRATTDRQNFDQEILCGMFTGAWKLLEKYIKLHVQVVSLNGHIHQSEFDGSRVPVDYETAPAKLSQKERIVFQSPFFMRLVLISFNQCLLPHRVHETGIFNMYLLFQIFQFPVYVEPSPQVPIHQFIY